jgi:deoxyinosine 3'endonuclease (endonuclease V)
MIACVDVDYRDVGAVAACVCFERWGDGTWVLESAIEISEINPYEPGVPVRRFHATHLGGAKHSHRHPVGL